ncbi:hypothetical protein CS022_05885 [Veronia nyctiphanis]|uniref:Uncharacterized protein n=1 Tax=Veronia nyctiphanis TaxID=1278244 RepID=A0A4Q0YSK9_9GAMM|nr:hypothetical protein [Veronia nyctiphanis]RXJ74146.1 hypothetical protein CS022_05885 [Veronia nyctiphanis]
MNLTARIRTSAALVAVLCSYNSGVNAEPNTFNAMDKLNKTFSGEADGLLKHFDRQVIAGGFMLSDGNFTGNSYSKYRITAGPKSDVLTNVEANTDLNTTKSTQKSSAACGELDTSVTLRVDDETLFETSPSCSPRSTIQVSKEFSVQVVPPALNIGAVCFDPFFCSVKLDNFSLESVIDTKITTSIGLSAGENGSKEDFFFAHATPEVKGTVEGAGSTTIDWWIAKWGLDGAGTINLDEFKVVSKIEFGIKHKSDLLSSVTNTAVGAANGAINAVAPIAGGIFDVLAPITNPIVDAGLGVVNAGIDVVGDVVDANAPLIGAVADGVITTASSILSNFNGGAGGAFPTVISNMLQWLPFQGFARLAVDYSVTAGSGSLSTNVWLTVWEQQLINQNLVHLTIPPLVNIPQTPLINIELLLWE